MTIRVEEAGSTEEALKVAYAVAHSPLVKTAFFASDPNLGRILAAVGYAGIDDLDVSNIRLWLDDVLVAVNGGRNPSYQEADGQRVMKQAEIAVHRAGPRPGQRHRLHLRLLARVRIDQRRLPFLIHPRAGADRAGAPCIETSGCVLPIARH